MGSVPFSGEQGDHLGPAALRRSPDAGRDAFRRRPRACGDSETNPPRRRAPHLDRLPGRQCACAPNLAFIPASSLLARDSAFSRLRVSEIADLAPSAVSPMASPTSA